MDKKRLFKEKGKQFYLDLLEKMVLIRRVEEKASQMYGLKKIGGFLHLYIGEEAIAVGSIAALNLEHDYVLTAYRDHGHALAVGMTPESVMAELYGKITGCSRGKGGSMHLFDEQKHFYGGNGIVGAHLPLATGVGLKIKYREEKGVVLCYFGDGAIHQGAFHESLNIASIWELPVIFICENNQYGMGTDYRRVSSVEDFSVMAASYGMPGKQVNGMDVLEVYHEVNAMVERARKESKPAFMEIKTYRYRGHSMSDPAKYRTGAELAEYKGQDPILILKNDLVENSLITEGDYQKLDESCRKRASEAAAFAEESDEPAIETLYEDLLVD